MDNKSEFNQKLLADLVLQRYTHILYLPQKNHGLIRPLKQAAPEELVESLGAYQLRIDEIEIKDMASGVDECFKFYVQTDLFEDE